MNFAQKTGISLTISRVQLTIRQSAQNFDRFFFARLKGEFNPHFQGFFGTNWDKSLAPALEACCTKTRITTIATMLTFTMRMDMAIRMMIALANNRSTISQRRRG